VTVVLRHNAALELNLVEYGGVITLAELTALARFVAANPEHMVRDGLAIVMPGARFADVDKAALDALFARYRKLYAPIEFQILRRSAWVCLSDAAAPQVRHWLSGDIREGMSSAVRQFDTLAAAGEWLVLSREEMALAERREGFIEVVRFDHAPALVR
jgi:hypothetical protein